jgi:phage terminase small subunit
MKLTPKQNDFAMHYLATRGNASEAYRLAYDAAAMKPQTIWRRAHELLHNGKVAARIEELKVEEDGRIKRKYQVDNDRVMRELVRLAFFDIGKAFDEKGNLKMLQDIDEDTRAALAGVEVVTRGIGRGDDRFVEYVHKFKLADKLGALEKLAKMLGMYREDNEQKQPPPPVTNVYLQIRDRLDRLYPDPEKAEVIVR